MHETTQVVSKFSIPMAKHFNRIEWKIIKITRPFNLIDENILWHTIVDFSTIKNCRDMRAFIPNGNRGKE